MCVVRKTNISPTCAFPCFLPPPPAYARMNKGKKLIWSRVEFQGWTREAGAETMRKGNSMGGGNMPRPIWRHEKMVFDAALIGKFMTRAHTRYTRG